MDYYSTLGVSRSATQEEIKKAFRQKAKEYHPDQTGGNDAMFKKINEAYETLKDPAKRRNYDNPSQQNRFDTGYTQQWESGNVESFHEFFRDIFGSSAGFHHSQYNHKNKNIQTVVKVSLESILHPQKKIVHLNTGRSEKTVEIDIPAGVEDNTNIKFNGFGQDILTRVPPGDLIVIIKVLDNPRFQRKNNNLYSAIDVDAIGAIIGTEVTFKTLDGSKINVKVPAGCQPSQMLRIKGKGLRTKDQVGDLYLMANITIPDLTDQQKEVLRSIYKSDS